MIVECIDDDFRIGTSRRKARGHKPIKGQLYEVVDTITIFVDGHDRLFYNLREFSKNQNWHHSFFREVDVNINELKEILTNAEPELV